MTRYVVGFMFDSEMKNVVLIRKHRPKWQAGLLNGVGGHIEDNELPLYAMIREYYEETGVKTSYKYWTHVLTMSFEYAVVYVFASNIERCFENSRTMTDEPIEKCSVENILNGINNDVIENIPALITLSIQRLTDHEGVAPMNPSGA